MDYIVHRPRKAYMYADYELARVDFGMVIIKYIEMVNYKGYRLH